MRTFLPGSTIGVLGSGQLGRMFAIEARRLGYRIHVYSPDSESPTGQVSDQEVQAKYEYLDSIARFAQSVDVVTYEFENIPIQTIEAVENHVPLFPGREAIYTTQNRLREKNFLRSLGIPVTPFHEISNPEHLNSLPESSCPGILKTAAWGYDGKGQIRVETTDELRKAWETLEQQSCILEKMVSIQHELSVIAAVGQDGDCKFYGPMKNDHANHILDLSTIPQDFSPEIEAQAKEITREIMKGLKAVGVLCVEFFLDANNELLVNEIAPRPHNSGHLTIDAHVCCQFEQQVRAVCGLPLGDETLKQPAAMANLLGDLWQSGEPDWCRVLEKRDLHLHLYGKKSAHIGRKMGHLTCLANDVKLAAKLALDSRSALVQHYTNENQDALKGNDNPSSDAFQKSLS